MGWVPEGQRAARMSIVTEDKSATYVTLGEETDVTFEAQSAGEGFEDVMASAGMRLLQSTMIKEEYGILGGNRSVALGTPDTPVATSASPGGSISSATLLVSVVALTLEGFLAASLADGVIQQSTITGLDNQTFVLNGGSSAASPADTEVIDGTGFVLSATVTAIKGAVAYAWYVGTSGAQKLEAITTINSVALTALAGTGQNVTAITADRSRNATLAFDGIMYAAYASSVAYYKSMATGVAGTGTPLTATAKGTISEIDAMFESFWENHRLSPEELYVNAQELKNISTKILTGSSSPLMRFNFDINEKDPKAVAGITIGYYFNPFSLDGGTLVPVKIHPNLPPGTILTWAQNLPAAYQAANVPQTVGMQCRREYYQIPWPLLTRANQTGVYAEEVLKTYAPFAIGTINNIGNG